VAVKLEEGVNSLGLINPWSVINIKYNLNYMHKILERLAIFNNVEMVED
jgi:hypothetical protein